MTITGAVLLDFSAAFNVIDHDLLIGKLTCFMKRTFMKSYISYRTQRVYYNGSMSNCKGLDCGLPQGSCLGPLLYSIFTNDLPSLLCKASLQMYEDDSTLYYAANTIGELDIVFSSVLKLVCDWIKQNKLVLNISNTKSIMIRSSHKLSSMPTLSLYSIISYI